MLFDIYVWALHKTFFASFVTVLQRSIVNPEFHPLTMNVTLTFEFFPGLFCSLEVPHQFGIFLKPSGRAFFAQQLNPYFPKQGASSNILNLSQHLSHIFVSIYSLREQFQLRIVFEEVFCFLQPTHKVSCTVTLVPIFSGQAPWPPESI